MHALKKPSLFELRYSPFHITLPKSSDQMNWISVRFYEMGDITICEAAFGWTSLIKVFSE